MVDRDGLAQLRSSIVVAVPKPMEHIVGNARRRYDGTICRESDNQVRGRGGGRGKSRKGWVGACTFWFLFVNYNSYVRISDKTEYERKVVVFRTD